MIHSVRPTPRGLKEICREHAVDPGAQSDGFGARHTHASRSRGSWDVGNPLALRFWDNDNGRWRMCMATAFTTSHWACRTVNATGGPGWNFPIALPMHNASLPIFDEGGPRAVGNVARTNFWGFHGFCAAQAEASTAESQEIPWTEPRDDTMVHGAASDG